MSSTNLWGKVQLFTHSDMTFIRVTATLWLDVDIGITPCQFSWTTVLTPHRPRISQACVLDQVHSARHELVSTLSKSGKYLGMGAQKDIRAII